ncbi:MAG: MBL fold metallo-hydrolase [Ignavibacteria bacterium]|jgi:phosphoribosyl 1,2-cyclic phosphodiesterase|nr:MBL fold metallo-hydrolase [Ignavibacteria bacterium]MCU7500268.1 MBL fold metallo-hydrolase [Ignavibacteria bacterium]MCU7513677.1 MBL fold metallo-hydrolase [Ignavibacteria bacterium]MCU7520652.1 MBL fold metallo-hydrolase [Ignavibacteria bacterium]MCU7523550.1 MBL fold metallo-hydrolase [Ignavibacteria bacterium]
MFVRFWGVRGSIPTPPDNLQIKEQMLALLEYASVKDISDSYNREQVLQDFLGEKPPLVGGNTSCVELRTDGKIIIFDMGTGLRKLGHHLLNELPREGSEYHIFLSHSHWDHIQGFPFFAPAYLPGNKIFFYSVHPDLKKRLERQQDFQFFPVRLENMQARMEFIQMQENCHIELGSLVIENRELYHPGKSFAYSVKKGNKKFVFATDSEYKDTTPSAAQKYISFFKDADFLVFDAQYTFSEGILKEDWGHSTSVAGIDLAVESGVKRIALFHHEPDYNDTKLYSMLTQAQRYRRINYPDSALEIILAYEGLELEV